MGIVGDTSEVVAMGEVLLSLAAWVVIPAAVGLSAGYLFACLFPEVRKRVWLRRR